MTNLISTQESLIAHIHKLEPTKMWRKEIASKT
jgi:hypothetical protein